MLKDSFKTKELHFLTDVYHILKLEESKNLFNEFVKKEKKESKIKEVIIILFKYFIYIILVL